MHDFAVSRGKAAAHASTEQPPPPTKLAARGGRRERSGALASKAAQKRPIIAALRKTVLERPRSSSGSDHALCSCSRVLTSSAGISRQPRIAPPTAPPRRAAASGRSSSSPCARSQERIAS